MKIQCLLLSLTLLAACSSSDEATQDAAAPTAPAPSPAPNAPAGPNVVASATGEVEDIDLAAKTITISHWPVDALKWPAMTMAFHAQKIDLGSIKKGDRVSFQFTSQGMDGTLVAIVVE